MDLYLENASAFVAGASSGLGKAIANALLLEGCQVAICSRNAARIQAAASELKKATGGNVFPVVCDVRDEGQIQQALKKTVKKFGSLNILVTNAGGPPPGGVDAFDAAAWREGLELNLMSTINLTRLSLPFLREAVHKPNGFGRILMISSLTAKQPIQSLLLSNVSRAGVQGFAKSLSEEVGSEGITVNTILPGYTRTDRLRHLSEAHSKKMGVTVSEVEDGWATNSALKRIGTEDEFAAAAAFLLSRRASYITGVALAVDGGAIKSIL